MKKFLIRLVEVALLLAMVIVGIVAIRLCLWQSEMNREFVVRDSTKIVVVGNSHAGCIWEDSEVLGVQVFWHSATAFPFAIFRLKEIIKRGGFKNAKVLLVPLDSADFALTDEWHKKRNFAIQFPLAWRYFSDIKNVSRFELIKRVLLPLSEKWEITESASTTDAPVSAEALMPYFKKESFTTIEDKAEEILSYIAEMREIVKNEGVELVFYASPMPPLYKGDKGIDAWINKVRDLGYSYIDYRKVGIPVEHFFDTNHLTYTGRKEFTRRHCKDFISNE